MQLTVSYIFRRHAHLLVLVEEVAVGAGLLGDAALEALPVLLAVLGVSVVERELHPVVRGALRAAREHSNICEIITWLFKICPEIG